MTKIRLTQRGQLLLQFKKNDSGQISDNKKSMVKVLNADISVKQLIKKRRSNFAI